MKKFVIAAALLCLIVCIAGCGDKEPADTALVEPDGTEAVINQTDDVTNAETKEPEGASGEALCGVYLNGGSVADIEMGIYYEGVQTNFCTVKMPTEYIFGAVYTDESGQGLPISGTGSCTLQEALDKGAIEEAENAFSFVNLVSFAEDRSNLMFRIETSEVRTMDDLKARVPDGVEFGTDAHPAYYFSDPDDEYEDLCVGYQVNDSILLTVTYSGPLADELGLAKLAQNIYDLVEVID